MNDRMLSKIIAWLRQPTTIGGLSVLFATIGALLQHVTDPAHGITLSQGLAPLIGALTALVMPDNSAANAGAVKTATDAMSNASANMNYAAANMAKKALTILILAGVMFAVSACAGQSGQSLVVSGTNYAVSTVDGAETALTAAENIAAVYVKLPLCPQPSGQLCSDPAVSAKLKALGAAADADLAKVKAGVADVTILVADINALASATPAVTATSTAKT